MKGGRVQMDIKPELQELVLRKKSEFMMELKSAFSKGVPEKCEKIGWKTVKYFDYYYHTTEIEAGGNVAKLIVKTKVNTPYPRDPSTEIELFNNGAISRITEKVFEDDIHSFEGPAVICFSETGRVKGVGFYINGEKVTHEDYEKIIDLKSAVGLNKMPDETNKLNALNQTINMLHMIRGAYNKKINPHCYIEP